MPPDDLEPDDGEAFATFCPDCAAHFYDGEEGHGSEECFECGSTDVYEVPA